MGRRRETREDDPREGIGMNISVEMRTMSPGLLERSGIHPMREVARKWCRANPVEAAALPSWNLDVLRSVLEGVA